MSATTILSTQPTPSLGSLGVVPCSSEGIIESLFRFISPPDFDKATEEVAQSVCTNYYQTFTTNCFTSLSPSTDLTCQIVVTHMNAATEGRIPDYEPGVNPYTGEGSPYWFTWNGVLAVEGFALLTGYSRMLIAEILFELHYATKDDRIMSAIGLDSVGTETAAHMRCAPHHTKGCAADLTGVHIDDHHT